MVYERLGQSQARDRQKRRYLFLQNEEVEAVEMFKGVERVEAIQIVENPLCIVIITVRVVIYSCDYG